MELSKLKSGISVVIITYNKIELLLKTIESFLQQNASANDFEIIVVDDGSNKENILDVIEIQNKTTIDILYIYQKDQGFGASKARNRGISAARFERVLFIDSGIIASKNLIAMHIKQHKIGSRDVIFGLSYGVVEFGMEGFESLREIISNCTVDESFEKLRSKSEFYDCRYNYFKNISFDLTFLSTSWAACWGGHVSANTKDLIHIGGFDEWFNSWGGEDVELAFRLREAGLKFKLIETMETIHLPHIRDADDQIKLSRKNIEYIIEKHQHPEVDLLRLLNWKDILNTKIFEKIEISA